MFDTVEFDVCTVAITYLYLGIQFSVLEMFFIISTKILNTFQVHHFEHLEYTQYFSAVLFE